MDVHGARVVRRPRVVEPVVVGEPRVRRRPPPPGRRCVRDRGRRRPGPHGRAPVPRPGVRSKVARTAGSSRGSLTCTCATWWSATANAALAPGSNASVPSSSRTLSQPASRNTRLRWTGRLTSARPYSDSTTTRRPCACRCSIELSRHAIDGLQRWQPSAGRWRRSAAGRSPGGADTPSAAWARARCPPARADAAIHSLDRRPDFGPQKSKNGNGPSSAVSRSQSEPGAE